MKIEHSEKKTGKIFPISKYKPLRENSISKISWNSQKRWMKMLYTLVFVRYDSGRMTEIVTSMARIVGDFMLSFYFLFRS